MKKLDDRDDNRDNYGNEYGNDDDNATAVSGSNGPIFDLITTCRLRLSLTEEDWLMTEMALRPL